MFDANVLIKRLPSFSVPKITVIRHVKSNQSCSKHGRPEQSKEKPLVPLNWVNTSLKQCVTNNKFEMRSKQWQDIKEAKYWS